jgi:hypothetical protein
MERSPIPKRLRFDLAVFRSGLIVVHKKVFAAVLIGFVVLAVIFLSIGGSFDKQFWLNFLPGLMENLAILALALFVIDSIFKKERLDKLEQTNASQSRFVLFCSNRLAFLLLEHLALATKEESQKDPSLNFEFALNKFRDTPLAVVFHEKLMQSEHKEDFVDSFEKLLSDQAKGISQALDVIYPRPDPAIRQIEEKMNFSTGSLRALKMLISAFKATNAQLGANEQLKPEHLNILIEIGYQQIGSALENIQGAIIHLSDRAKNNKLFIFLD